MNEARSFSVHPIGFVRSPFTTKVEAPRQAVVARDVTGTIELLPAYEHALADVEGFERLWILFWFDRVDASGFRAKVQPPRSDRKRGVFATRSPHRPNPIGLSAVRLERVEGCTLFVRELDLLDGTPVLDVKPYVAYADAFPDARAGWLDEREPRDRHEPRDPSDPRDPRDPLASWTVRFHDDAEAHLAWISAHSELDLRERITAALSLGPTPLPYRRIKKMPDGSLVLAVKDWRARFSVEERTIVVERIASGYRTSELTNGTTPAHLLQRAFVERFG